MTGKELLEKLQKFTPEQLNCPVCFPISKNSDWTELEMNEHIFDIFPDNMKEPWFIFIYPDLKYFYEKIEETN